MQVAPTYWPAAGGVTGPPGSTTDRGYGWAYQQARDALLASNPKCHWCPAPATTADHEPPIHVVGHAHLNLVPSCGPCNYSRQAGDTAAAAVAWAKAPRLVTVPDVELARLGTWACSTGVCTFAQEDFDSAIAASRDPEVFGAPVKVGHTDPRFASLDGYPSLGWVTNVHQLGDRLRGDLVDVPEPLAEVMSAAFKRRSIEMAWGVRTPSGNRYRAAVVGLALLGVTPPAVSGLADVLSMFHGETTFDVAARAAEGGVTSVVWSEDWPVSPTTAWAAGDTGAGAYFAGGLMPEPMTEARLRQLLALQGEADLEGALVRMRHAASGGAPPAAPTQGQPQAQGPQLPPFPFTVSGPTASVPGYPPQAQPTGPQLAPPGYPQGAQAPQGYPTAPQGVYPAYPPLSPAWGQPYPPAPTPAAAQPYPAAPPPLPPAWGQPPVAQSPPPAASPPAAQPGWPAQAPQGYQSPPQGYGYPPAPAGPAASPPQVQPAPQPPQQFAPPPAPQGYAPAGYGQPYPPAPVGAQPTGPQPTGQPPGQPPAGVPGAYSPPQPAGQPGVPDFAPGTPGAVVMGTEAVAALSHQAAVGFAAARAMAERDRETVLGTYLQTGRIAPASVPTWRQAYDRDPSGTMALLATQPQVFPVAAVGDPTVHAGAAQAQDVAAYEGFAAGLWGDEMPVTAAASAASSNGHGYAPTPGAPAGYGS